ncbi:MAG: hypothetical protein IK120_02140 [Muribaculaceae bacterium]|nr:hypothetical protein [Muribaculaceae bacterium]MBR5435644.1 hypothetical protein [Muribaculaceae bacterium]
MKILGYILLALGTLLLLLALLPMFDFNITKSVVSSSILVILVGLLLVYMGHLNDNEKGGKGD